MKLCATEVFIVEELTDYDVVENLSAFCCQIAIKICKLQSCPVGSKCCLKFFASVCHCRQCSQVFFCVCEFFKRLSDLFWRYNY